MSIQRPTVSVFNAKTAEVVKEVALPDVFQAPIRPDIVSNMVNFLRMNLRQPYGVHKYAGHQHSAISWGTGRAVSRIPRVSGGGTHRAGQGAFGNMCRKGRMFSPTRTWRRWMHVVKKNERRYATASAIAASSITPLVQARGHKVEQVKQLPLVVTDDLQFIAKTKEAVAFLKKHGLLSDAKKAKDSKTLRKGRGKMRNRRYTLKKGPLVVYNAKAGTQTPPIVLALRNLPGVDVLNVNQLNLLKLAPGGHPGRLIVWTESAFNALNEKFGSYNNEKGASTLHFRSGATYHLPRPVAVNTDSARIIESDAVQAALKPKKVVQRFAIKKQNRSNPLRNFKALVRLNPYALKARRLQLLRERRAKVGAGKAAQKK
ncbi:hypothetical protein C9374_012051 [Naegleria lovaniensis]|uniref:Large ribosomal subunit protein uL4 n=1 Tax=Naegleria lovaniensis TaxID=51637 RepID=A0AA88GGC0_NAELO|nr:uncharacterized protein C9374_012009 [Naegleria lovaniensis]XP_044542762.1 uncharacterized protein C9374_012051 [Naegleria lovaniensis]KAG2373546.1 hypothetical protein C9374_012009 [Naegleria lovaniensis]KAG2373588.1 hypothetical protein C9374_012051 [Naegleria lovaniensis]